MSTNAKMPIVCLIKLFCWICAFSLAFLFISFMMTVWEESISQSEWFLNSCTRTQFLLGAECARKTRRLEDALLKVNKTVQFLRPPSDYRVVADLCEKTERCVGKINCEEARDYVFDFRDSDTLLACEFYRFYAEEFAECGQTLIALASNETCLGTLFSTEHLARYNRCEQWLTIQPCVQQAIIAECGSNGITLAYRFGQVASSFYRGMKCNPTEFKMDYGGSYYEVILPLL